MPPEPAARIFCAIDTADLPRAQSLAAAVAAQGFGIKLGLEFFNGFGPDGVRAVMAESAAPLFLDLKFHDIPNTVAQAVRAACTLRPAYLNVHAAGGAAMLRAAADAAGEAGVPLLAVTVLTSLAEADLRETGVTRPLADHVLGLTDLALSCGLAGVVCSAHEIAPLRARFGPAPVLMVPGIRPAGSAANDQSRIMTPRAALDAGATHLVIGRPITAAADPGAAAADILAEL